jgi:hypothetical protein
LITDDGDVFATRTNTIEFNFDACQLVVLRQIGVGEIVGDRVDRGGVDKEVSYQYSNHQ